MALIIDTTCEIQEKDQRLRIKCSKCKYIREFQMKTGYKLWLERPEAIMEAAPPKVIKEQMVGKRNKKNLAVVASGSDGLKDSGDVIL